MVNDTQNHSLTVDAIRMNVSDPIKKSDKYSEDQKKIYDAIDTKVGNSEFNAESQNVDTRLRYLSSRLSQLEHELSRK